MPVFGVFLFFFVMLPTIFPAAILAFAPNTRKSLVIAAITASALTLYFIIHYNYYYLFPIVNLHETQEVRDKGLANLLDMSARYLFFLFACCALKLIAVLHAEAKEIGWARLISFFILPLSPLQLLPARINFFSFLGLLLFFLLSLKKVQPEKQKPLPKTTSISKIFERD